LLQDQLTEEKKKKQEQDNNDDELLQQLDQSHEEIRELNEVPPLPSL
jgi:hypothetical protein